MINRYPIKFRKGLNYPILAIKNRLKINRNNNFRLMMNGMINGIIKQGLFKYFCIHSNIDFKEIST